MSALHKVLVVDDDPVVGRSFNRVLSQKDYVVITAQNAQEALAKMEAEEYDVVFTDIKMPGMDGLELAERVKAKRPWTPVVIVTGYGTTANEERAKAAGVSAFLHKPLSPEMITETTMHALLEPAPIIIPQEEISHIETVRPEPGKKESKLKNVVLFMAAPFIGLVYAVLFPFFGIGMMAYMGIKALAKITAVKNVVLLIAAPFVGLAYVVMLPFFGTAALAWIGVQALMKKTPIE
jgi:CheY-like chemotaxis protein